jgi:hypothetical protein
MALETLEEVCVVRDYAAHIEEAVFDREGRRCTPSAICRQTIKIYNCIATRLFGIMFGAFAVLHARTFFILRTARAMDHVLLHELEELGTYGWIRDFSGDYTIDLLRGSWLVLITNDEEYVDVRQATLLELYNVRESDSRAKDIFLCQFVQEFNQLGAEDAGHQIRSVGRRLTFAKVILDLWPVGVCCHSEEIIGTAIAGH